MKYFQQKKHKNEIRALGTCLKASVQATDTWQAVFKGLKALLRMEKKIN